MAPEARNAGGVGAKQQHRAKAGARVGSLSKLKSVLVTLLRTCGCAAQLIQRRAEACRARGDDHAQGVFEPSAPAHLSPPRRCPAGRVDGLQRQKVRFVPSAPGRRCPPTWNSGLFTFWRRAGFLRSAPPARACGALRKKGERPGAAPRTNPACTWRARTRDLAYRRVRTRNTKSFSF